MHDFPICCAGDRLPDPPRRRHQPVSGRRRVFLQEPFDAAPLAEIGRPRLMADLVRRAMEYFARLEEDGHMVEWHTLDFEVQSRTGAVPEVWRWTVWIS